MNEIGSIPLSEPIKEFFLQLATDMRLRNLSQVTLTFPKGSGVPEVSIVLANFTKTTHE
jgi:hypothetical protein